MTGFVKMSGAGNDFIVFDNRDSSLDLLLTPENIRRLCSRGLSVGADGLLELRECTDASFRMKYYNSDGAEAHMCGNGGRCISAFAATIGAAPITGRFRFMSNAGLHTAELFPDGTVSLWMTEPVIHYLNREISTPAGIAVVSHADTGVPHAVTFLDDLSDDSFERLAPMIRSHSSFLPEGANSTFVSSIGRSQALIRTWERGVEGETLACGTGAVAAALIGRELGIFELPLDIRVKSGLILSVGLDSSGWWLRGEARTVFEGSLKDHWYDA